MSFSFSNQRQQGYQRQQLPNLSLSPFHAGLPVALPVGSQVFHPLQIQTPLQAHVQAAQIRAHQQAQVAQIRAQQQAQVQLQQQAPQGQSVASELNLLLRKANQRSFSGVSYVP